VHVPQALAQDIEQAPRRRRQADASTFLLVPTAAFVHFALA
jgi:hypothetical protein